jgi:hypothetical protein
MTALIVIPKGDVAASVKTVVRRGGAGKSGQGGGKQQLIHTNSSPKVFLVDFGRVLGRPKARHEAGASIRANEGFVKPVMEGKIQSIAKQHVFQVYFGFFGAVASPKSFLLIIFMSL